MQGDEKLMHQIRDAIEKIRPYILSDGGDIEIVDFSNGVLKVKLLGACVMCPASAFTLKFGIEKALKESIPAITSVEADV